MQINTYFNKLLLLHNCSLIPISNKLLKIMIPSISQLLLVIPQMIQYNSTIIQYLVLKVYNNDF